MSEDLRICEKCKKPGADQRYPLAFYPTFLCTKCVGEFEQYIRSIPEYKEWFCLSFTLAKIKPGEEGYIECLEEYFDIQTKLLPLILKWLNKKKHKRGDLVSIKKEGKK